MITPNSWRERIGAKQRGRTSGGQILHEPQVELDCLLQGMCQGVSEVTERKEVVGPDDVDARLPR